MSDPARWLTRRQMGFIVRRGGWRGALAVVFIFVLAPVIVLASHWFPRQTDAAIRRLHRWRVAREARARTG